jgi:hypothetical protein
VPGHKRKLICKHCWIEVIATDKPNRVIGRGAVEGEITYHHRTFRDDVGSAYCGRSVLSAEDVEWDRAVTE